MFLCVVGAGMGIALGSLRTVASSPVATRGPLPSNFFFFFAPCAVPAMSPHQVPEPYLLVALPGLSAHRRGRGDAGGLRLRHEPQVWPALGGGALQANSQKEASNRLVENHKKDTNARRSYSSTCDLAPSELALVYYCFFVLRAPYPTPSQVVSVIGHISMPKNMGVAAGIAAQQRFRNGKYARFKYMYWTESDQVQILAEILP